MLPKKIIINGKRVSSSRLEVMIDDAVENIILAGFTTVEELDHLATINGRNSQILIDYILYKIQLTYSDSINHLRDKSLADVTEAKNISKIIDKHILVLKLIQQRRNEYIEAHTDIDDEDDYFTTEEEDLRLEMETPVQSLADILEKKQEPSSLYGYNNLVVRDSRNANVN